VVKGTFSGTVTSGYANGNFGYAYGDGSGDAIVGKTITGTFSFDTTLLGGPIASCSGVWQGAYFFGCFASNAGMSISETVNGVTERFTGTPSAAPGLQLNSAVGGEQLYNLTDDVLNIGTASSIGTPATVWTGASTGLAVLLPRGTIADPGNAVLTYAGAASDSPYGAPSVDGLTFLYDETSIQQLTGGNFTMKTDIHFDIDHFTIAAVPEAASWATMVAGFGFIGAMTRRRRPARA
jgi:hypothetical protein